ncbi:MAG: type II secretion system protein [Firmicutes bacterium]|nr:type II secretion system protein [Bacillota bacterium]
MKNKKNGFTLIEMLVCIGIIAALGVVIGLNATKVLGDAQKDDNKEVMQELFESAMLYSELSTSHCNFPAALSCTVSLNNLISTGLLDETFVKKNNPLFENQKFSGTDSIIITKNASTKKKSAQFQSGSCTLTESQLETAVWGGC